MKMGILRVSAIYKPQYRTRIHIRSPWIDSMGFVPGTLVRVVSRQDGFTLAIHNESSAMEKVEGSKFIRVGLEKKKLKPCCQMGVYLTREFSVEGLVAGDFLAAGYDYGIIEARKLPSAREYVVIASKNYSAYLRLNGDWLSDIGFIPDSVVTVSLTQGSITLKVWNDSTMAYSELVKLARQNKYQIIQVRKNQHITRLDLTGHLLNSAGFNEGDISGIHYDYGMIRLFQPDLQRIGF